MEFTKVVDEILVSLDFPKEEKSRTCFVVFSSKEEHIEIVIDCVERVIKEKLYYNVIRLDEALKSGDSQYTELTSFLNTCSFAVVVLDGFRPNVLFEYGILRGLGKPCIVLLEKEAIIDVKSLMPENYRETIDNPRIDIDKHFSDVKDRFYLRYNKNNPKELRNIIDNEYLKLKKDIDNEFIRMIFPNKDFVEQELREKLINLSNIFNKDHQYFSAQNELEFYSLLKGIETISTKHHINLPTSYFFVVARIYEMFGKYEEALNTINPLISKDKNKSKLLAFKSFILRRLEKYREAISVLDEAIIINPNFEPFWHNKAILLDILKKKNEALLCYEKGINLDNKCSSINFHYGILLYEKNRFKAALAQFESALIIEPTNSDYLLWKAKAHYKLKKCDEAIRIAKEIVSSSDQNADAWFSLGIWTQNETEALKYFNKAIQINQNHGGALCSKAACLSNLGRYKEALKIFKSMKNYCSIYNKCKNVSFNILATISNAKIKPTEEEFILLLNGLRDNTPDVLNTKAIVACSQGQIKKGLVLFKKALDKAPKNAVIWFNQACVFSTLKKSSDAIKSLKRAISLAPSRRKEMIKNKDFDNIRKSVAFIKAFGT